MGKILKFLLYAVAALVALFVIAAVLFTLLFDANDFRDKIAAGISDATGRELVIEGDLEVSLFPWLAIDVGKTRLGNAEGFGDEPFMSFERARLSVRVLPLISRQEVSIGTADRGEVVDDRDVPPETDKTATLDIASITVSNANLQYDNAQLGERYLLSDLNISTGAFEPGAPIDIDGSFGFRVQPSEAAGKVKIETTVQFEPDAAMIRFDDLAVAGSVDGDVPRTFVFSSPQIELQTEERIADVGQVRINVLDVTINADVEPFSYADSPKPSAAIKIDAFSPRSLMQQLAIDVPETADPDALGRMMLDAKMVVTDRTIRLSGLRLEVDDTTLTGGLVIPRDSGGRFDIDLAADEIDLNRYMEPATGADASARGEEVPVEIPVDLLRSINVRGDLAVARGTLGRLQFDTAKVSLNLANGQLRLHPMSAQFFDGSYEGDVRINAAANVPVLSVNERIQNVSLGALALAMFEQEKVTGQINGTFRLEGRGNDMAEIQKTLAGNMSFVLSDGAWEGADVWYELRRARALFKKEAPPEPTLPARTRFSEVSATGVVSDGVMQNDDFRAELPFMQLTGRGTVDFPAATMDYSLTGRVLEKPEFAGDATAEEIKDLTQAVIPLKITGPLASPKFAIDFGALIRERAEEEIKKRVIDKLLGGDDEEPVEGEEEEQDPEDALKDALKDLIGR